MRAATVSWYARAMGLLERFRRSAAQPDSATISPEVAAVLAELTGVVVAGAEGRLAAADVDADANVFDYGYLDSVGLTAFLAAVETRFGVSISDEELVTRLTTLRAMAAHVVGARSTRA
jgi:acyl carrier protein